MSVRCKTSILFSECDFMKLIIKNDYAEMSAWTANHIATAINNHCTRRGVLLRSSENFSLNLLIPQYPHVYCIRTTLQLVPLKRNNLSHSVCAVSISTNGPTRKRY